jgi:hypothetical protein
MEIQILVWKKLSMVAGLKLLMDHNPPDYFNIWSPNKDIKKQYKKPSFLYLMSRGERCSGWIDV